MESKPETRRLAAILFADIVGYTSMMQADEGNAMNRLRHYQNTLQEEVTKHEGEVIKSYGDGSLCLFKSVLNAVECSKILQEKFQQEAPRIPLRLGLHMGDVMFEQNDIYGNDINIASRIESMGIAGSVLMSKNIQRRVKNQSNLKFTSLGTFEFKNVEEPIEVYSLANEGMVVPKRNELEGKINNNNNKGNRKTKMYQLVILGLVFALTAFFFYNRSTSKNESVLSLVEDPVIDKNSIAILPFVNRSTDEENQYFADGMHDDLMTFLSKTRNLKVISRTSVAKFIDTDKDIGEIAKLLGVAHIMEGAVRRVGNQVRINVQLIEAETDNQLWAETYDIEFSPKNIFEIQTDIASKISNELTINIFSPDSTPEPEQYTDNLIAYENFLRANQLKRKRSGDSKSLLEAKQLLEEAIALDDQFAEAYISLGNLYIFLIFYAGEDSESGYSKAWDLMEKGMAIDQNFAGAYQLKGQLLNRWKNDLDAASKAFEQAIRINPNSNGAYYGYAVVKQRAGKPNTEILDLVNKALAMNPLSSQLINLKAYCLKEDGQFQKAIKTYQQGIELAPGNLDLWIHYSSIYYFLAQIDSVAMVSHQNISANGKKEVYLQMYLNSLNDLAVLPELEKELNTDQFDSKQDSLVRLSYLRELYLHKKDFEKAEALSAELSTQNVRWLDTKLYDFQIAYYKKEYSKAKSLFEKINKDIYQEEADLSQIDKVDLQSFIFCLKQLGEKNKAQNLAKAFESAFLISSLEKSETLYESQMKGYLKCRNDLMNNKVESGLELLEEYFEAGYFYKMKNVSIDPIFDVVRKEKQFLDLINKYESIQKDQQSNFRRYLTNEEGREVL